MKQQPRRMEWVRNGSRQQGGTCYNISCSVSFFSAVFFLSAVSHLFFHSGGREQANLNKLDSLLELHHEIFHYFFWHINTWKSPEQTWHPSRLKWSLIGQVQVSSFLCLSHRLQAGCGTSFACTIDKFSIFIHSSALLLLYAYSYPSPTLMARLLVQHGVQPGQKLAATKQFKELTSFGKQIISLPIKSWV